MTDPGTQQNELALVELVSKLFALFIGLLYFIGFVVVAAHLSRYGVSSFSVLQLQYLIAGFWSFGPPVGLGLVLLTARGFEEGVAPEIPGMKFNWRRFLIACIFTGIPYGIYVVLLVSIPGIVQNMTWGIGIRLYLFYWVMIISAQILWKSWRIPVENETRWSNRRAVPFYSTLLLMIALGYVLWFSVRVYPLIPFSLGGGGPLAIVFMEGEKKFPHGIIADTSTPNRSIQYMLLAETDKYYVVVSNNRNEKSIELNKDSVAGIVVLGGSRVP